MLFSAPFSPFSAGLVSLISRQRLYNPHRDYWGVKIVSPLRRQRKQQH